MNRLNGVLLHIYLRWLRPDPVRKLKARGLVVGNNFNMRKHVTIDRSHCWHITIGDDVTLAPGVHILAHDASTKIHLGYTRIGKVNIGDRVFIGASSVVLPGVRIGNDVIVGAGSVVSRSIPDNVVVCGNPAKELCATDQWLNRRKREVATGPCFGEEFTIRRNVTEDMKAEMNERMTDGIGYIV